ncbi:Uncharacterised protein (plasmid) [Tsukamurella tyrosinosolvens]|uniref:Uncharacterized protein n=1 Tax=Tsukamurella tyrosinosolvens TaxID=57704 RepID=A0A1H4VP12_TSUTY|nr:hypothetical protein [Tsukamurella tyrosinosolvens]KXO90922.1 hypothetical protein AXK58_21040 [Tsukamurella tyrosinosolvens]SEC82859.1 hypothetical protein SAMN04489793_3293 [Tsukamurella tyrosinosolvens]VEH90387.1 Uncharacterised protein [Tsukamurella tyrosinosolvens]
MTATRSEVDECARQRAEGYARATWLAMKINPGGGFETKDLPVPEWLIASHLEAMAAERVHAANACSQGES